MAVIGAPTAASGIRRQLGCQTTARKAIYICTLHNAPHHKMVLLLVSSEFCLANVTTLGDRSTGPFFMIATSQCLQWIALSLCKAVCLFFILSFSFYFPSYLSCGKHAVCSSSNDSSTNRFKRLGDQAMKHTALVGL